MENSERDGIPGHLTCLLRNLYAGGKTTVRTGHGTTGWFQIGKGVHQGCIFSPCLFNLYVEHIMRNASLDEAQARSKTAGRNINNLSYADGTTFFFFYKYFLSFSKLSFHFVYNFLCCERLLCLIRFHLFVSVFISITLGDGSKRPCCDSCQRVFYVFL